MKNKAICITLMVALGVAIFTLSAQSYLPVGIDYSGGAIVVPFIPDTAGIKSRHWQELEESVLKAIDRLRYSEDLEEVNIAFWSLQDIVLRPEFYIESSGGPDGEERYQELLVFMYENLFDWVFKEPGRFELKADSICLMVRIIASPFNSESNSREMARDIFSLSADNQELKIFALNRLADIFFFHDADEAFKEFIADNLLSSIYDADEGLEVKHALLRLMAHLLHNPNFNPGISLQEKVAEYLLNNLDGLKEDSEIKRIVIGSLLWSGAVQNSSIDSLLKERITSEIEARCITEDNRSIWEDFGVLVLGEFDELEHLVIYAVIDFLPPAIKPPYFITTGRIGPNGNYDFVLKTVVLNMELVSASFLARVLIHEIGHHVHCGQFTAEENDRWKELWALSLELEDFACYYGRENMLEDIATAFESYVYNTQGFLAQTTANLEQSGRDVRLRKIEFLAKLFAHTSADGTPVTYAYEIHGSPFGDYFSITLRQVALAEQVIVGETYLLPDCDRVINSRVYEYNGWSSHDN